VFVGIDWGHLNWVIVIGINYTNQRTYLLNIGVFEDDKHRELDSVKHIEAFIAPFEPDLIVADGGYGKDRNTYLLRKYPGKVFACLAGDTKVATLDAQGWKHIKDVKVGDYTHAWDGSTYVPTRVTHTHSNGMRKTVKVTCKDGNGREKTIICTPDHEFMLRLGGTRMAGDLKAGDRLVPFNRYSVKRGKYRMVVRVEPGPTIPVYDLTVEHAAHNFALHDSVFVKNCWYSAGDKGGRTFQPSWQDASSKVNIDRTVSLKNAARCIKEGEIGLPAPDHLLGLFMKHMLNLAPLRVEEDGEIYEVIENVGDDHLAHAFGYALVAQERFKAGLSNFSVVGGWDEAST
jgi:hypothetical protein